MKEETVLHTCHFQLVPGALFEKSCGLTVVVHVETVLGKFLHLMKKELLLV